MNAESNTTPRRTVRLGDSVVRCPVTLYSNEKEVRKNRRGTVVYIHPLNRFHTVQFGDGKRVLRESFLGVER